MALPGNLAQVWVVGQLLRDDGTPQRGRVTFLPSTNALVDQANDLTVATWAPYVAVLSPSGTFAVKLPATDAPGWTPTGWTYQVREPVRRSYHLAVPAATPVLNDPDDLLHGQRVMDLSDAVPLPEPNPGTVQVIAPEPASPEQIAAAVQGYLDANPPDGELAEQVTELDMEQDAHHVRLNALEAASDDLSGRLQAIEAVGALAPYEHTQTAAQSVWTVVHGLGRYPVAWSLFDTTGALCDGYLVQHLDEDTTRVSMDLPTAGLIRLV